MWRKLTAALSGIPTATPSASALCQARRQVGAAPLRWLFELLRGPVAIGRAPGTWWRGLLVCAIDGTTLTVPDAPAVLTRFTKHPGNHGGTGYPQILLADRNFGARDLFAGIAATGADVLVRLKNAAGCRCWPATPDSSYLSVLGGLRVRVVECQITIATTPGAPPASTGWPPACSITTATPQLT